jgi:hypothetical protein
MTIAMGTPTRLAIRNNAGCWSVELEHGVWLECDSEEDALHLASAPVLKWRCYRGDLDNVLGVAELCCLAALFRGYGQHFYADAFEALATRASDRMALTPVAGDLDAA